MKLDDRPVTTDRVGHEISDDYDREVSVIEQVLAAAVKRREEKSKTGHGGQVNSKNLSFNIYWLIEN